MSIVTWNNLSKPASAETTSAVRSVVKSIITPGTSAIDTLRARVSSVEGDVKSSRDEIARVAKTLESVNVVLKTIVDDIKQLKDISKNLTAVHLQTTEQLSAISKNSKSQDTFIADHSSKIEKIAKLADDVTGLSESVALLKSAKLDGDVLEQLQSEVYEIKSIVIGQLFPDTNVETSQ